MKQISIIGVSSCRDMTTVAGLRAIERAELLIGGEKTTSMFAYLGKRAAKEWRVAMIKQMIENETAGNIAVLFSGDVGYHSGGNKLARELEECGCAVSLIPGVPTVSVFFAKLRLPWQDAKLISMHGGERDIVTAVRDNYYTFCLTSRNKREVAQRLADGGLGGVRVFVGDNLDSSDADFPERIFETTVEEAAAQLVDEYLTVLLFVNDANEGAV